MTVTLENKSNLSFAFPYEDLACEVVEAALEFEQFPYEAEISILLVTREEIHALNYEMRNVDAPTDVLSFPLIDYPAPGDFSMLERDGDNFHPDTGEALLGDVVLCAEKVKEQAKAYGHSEKREFCFLILHSLLHLLGYDHMTEPEAAVMEQKQREILDLLQIYR